MRKQQFAAALAISAACLAATGPALAQPSGRSCFFITEWNGWKAPDDHTIYIGVSMHKVYRLDLASSCPQVTWPDAHLIYHDQSGSGSICGPLDLDLKVGSGDHSIPTPCIVSKMTELTPEQAAAIPKKFRPN